MKTLKITLPLLILTLILIIGMGGRLRGIATTHQERAISRPLEDDSYFYFSLGRHIANGDGAMIDDRHLTTGFQPLWGGIVASVFVLVQADSLAIGVVQLMGALAGALGCILIYDLTRRITKSEMGALAVCALWFWSPQSLRNQLNGMETGIATVSAFALFYVTYRAYQERTWRWHLIAGAVFGLAFMARIDTGMLIAPCGVLLIAIAPPIKTQFILYEGQKKIRRNTPIQALVHRVRVGVLMALVAVIFVIPWVLFTLSINKPILPESGDAVRAASLYVYPDPPPQPVLTVLTENTPRFLDYYGGWAADFTRSLASQVWAIAPLSDNPKYPADPVDGSRLSEHAYLFMGAVVLMVILAMASGDGGFRWLAGIYAVWWVGITAAYVLVIYGIWYFARYSLPLAEVISVLVLIGVLKIIPTGKKFITIGGRVLVSAMLMVILAGHIHTYLNDDFYTWLINGGDSLRQDGWDVAVDWLEANVPPQALVGSVFASGVIGFHAPQDVINLDGKVNREAYRALVARRMWEYVCASGLEYTVDWGSSTDALLINRAPRSEWREDNMPVVAEFVTESVASVQIRRVNRANCATIGS